MSKDQAPKKLEMRIRDKIYDVTDFVKKHPGGSVINYYLNADATEAYEEMHRRHPSADKYLKVLPSRPVSDNDNFPRDPNEQVLVDFRNMRDEFIKEGRFDANYFHCVLRIIELVVLFAAHFWLLSQGWLIPAFLVGGLAGGRCGWVQHEGGHNSFTTIPVIDKVIQKITISFGLIVSGPKWNNMHNKHHATPQKVDFDVDVDTLPFVAFYRAALTDGRRSELASKWWISLQHYTFLPLTTVINVFFWHLYLHPREYLVRSKDFTTFFWIIMRYVATYYFSPEGTSIPMSMFYLYASMFISGIYLFGNFSLSHTHLPVVAADEDKNWVDYGLVYTANIDPTWFNNWWMGYLNCQIEHHLFPTMPQHKQPGITARVRQFAEKHNMPYLSMPYLTALSTTLGNLKEVASHADDLDVHLNKKKSKKQE